MFSEKKNQIKTHKKNGVIMTMMTVMKITNKYLI